ncbi:uncharacterized protein J3R85_010431 [Psidium guajava]|nr:uncharacterized protein J3R85_010431 [Psidium guajava]
MTTLVPQHGEESDVMIKRYTKKIAMKRDETKKVFEKGGPRNQNGD